MSMYVLGQLCYDKVILVLGEDFFFGGGSFDVKQEFKSEIEKGTYCVG